MIKRPCLGCKEAFPVAELRGGRCRGCGPGHVARKERRRQAEEPWRQIYSLQAWKAARQRALMRDGNQCTVIETGRRCEEKSHLEVAHIIPLRKLWTVTHGAAFVRAATALSNLTTACPHHNRLLDEEARKEKVA